MKRATIAIAFSTILFGMSSTLFAQTQGKIEGTVMDEDGAMIPNSRVTLGRASGDEPIRETRTDNSGRYGFSGVTPGVYVLSVSAQNFARAVKRTVTISSDSAVQNIVFSFEPCREDGPKETGAEPPITIRAEIVRALIDAYFAGKPVSLRPFLVPRNIDSSWLTPGQRGKVTIVSRSALRTLTELQGSQSYFYVSSMTMRDNCVGVSMIEGVTVKGQSEDANMAGGSSVFEFRRVDGQWVALRLATWIS